VIRVRRGLGDNPTTQHVHVVTAPLQQYARARFCSACGSTRTKNKHAGESTPWYGSNTCERTAVQMVRGQRSQRTEDSQTGEAGRRAARTQRGPASHYVETPRARPFGRALCTNAVRHDSRACASPGGGTNNHRLSSKGVAVAASLNAQCPCSCQLAPSQDRRRSPASQQVLRQDCPSRAAGEELSLWVLHRC